MCNTEEERTEQTAAIADAAAERKFEATDFLDEILPLLQSYFIGNFTRTGSEIEAAFLNGQTLRLSVHGS
ncbi:MAG: hypothetical protein K2H43_05650 [Clostridia bacterium]|nr:hypothetical protein [Clostridia bacterium]